MSVHLSSGIGLGWSSSKCVHPSPSLFPTQFFLNSRMSEELSGFKLAVYGYLASEGPVAEVGQLQKRHQFHA